jgi:DNA-binding transcriptional LysR family regulator
MTLDQLRIFAAVAELGHMTRAAEALNMSQSSASIAIAALETRYRIKLFDRVGRGIQLTENGRKFLREALAVLDRANLARAALHELAGTRGGSVSIAASMTIASYWLPRRLAAFHALNSDVRLNVVIRNTNDVETAVIEGQANIGLVEGPTEHPALIRQPLDEDSFVLVVAPNYPSLAVDGSGRIDLKSGTWVIREVGSGTRRGIEDLAAQEGISLNEINIALELPSNEAVREATEAGVGATVISRHVVASAIAAGNLIEFPVDLPRREYALLHHRDRHASVPQRALIAHLTGGAKYGSS